MNNDDKTNLNNQTSVNQPGTSVEEVKTDSTPVTPVEEVKTPSETVTESEVVTPEETVKEPEVEVEQPIATEDVKSEEIPAQEEGEKGEEIEETVEPEKTDETPAVEAPVEETHPEEVKTESTDEDTKTTDEPTQDEPVDETPVDDSGARWYVVHTYSGHENRVATTLKQRIDSEGLTDKIVEILVPTQEKIEIKNGKKQTVKEKIFPGYILVKMILDDNSWLAIRTTQGVTSFVGALNKPTPIPESEVQTIVKFMQAGGQPTYKQVIAIGDTVKIVDGPFSDMIGKAEEVDKEKGKIKVLVSIFGRETPVELDFLQVNKL